MTIKQQGGIFGRNPAFNSIESNKLVIPRTTPNLEISSGVITPVGSYHKIDTEGDASTDDLDTITATKEGHVLVISPQSSTRDVVVKDGTGNLRLHSDFTMTHADDTLTLLCDGSDWVEISRNATLQNSYNIKFEDGYGIDFSATSGTGTSELFDDYEEGTWTPTYTTDGTDFDSVNYDSRTHGRYVKIGSLVYVSATLQTDGITVGFASGDVLIGGLPYTSSNDPSNAATYAGAVISSDFAGDMPSEAYVDRNATTIRLNYRATSNGASVNLQVADMATSSNDNYVQLSFAYRV